MPFIFGLSIVIGVIYVVSQFIREHWQTIWIIIVSALALWASVVVFQKIAAENRKREELQERKKRDEAARLKAIGDRRALDLANHKQERVDQLRKLEQARQSYEHALTELPILLFGAKRALITAQDDFSDHAYSPFWDAIERAVNELARFNRLVDITKNTVSELRGMKLLSGVTRIELPVAPIPDAAALTSELSKLVRKAQTDIHFTQIYEVRKTNQILTDGFQALGTALGDIGYSIDRSVSNLRDDLRDYQRETEKYREDADEDTATHREKVEGMLDNIQHRRKPEA